MRRRRLLEGVYLKIDEAIRFKSMMKEYHYNMQQRAMAEQEAYELRRKKLQ